MINPGGITQTGAHKREVAEGIGEKLDVHDGHDRVAEHRDDLHPAAAQDDVSPQRAHSASARRS